MESVFDGWEKKIEHVAWDDLGGFCVRGWLNRTCRNTDEVERRVGLWIQQNLDPPEVYMHRNGGDPMCPARWPEAALVWANNECKLDIEGFRMVDLLTQGYVPEETPEEAMLAGFSV